MDYKVSPGRHLDSTIALKRKFSGITKIELILKSIKTSPTNVKLYRPCVFIAWSKVPDFRRFLSKITNNHILCNFMKLQQPASLNELDCRQGNS